MLRDAMQLCLYVLLAAGCPGAVGEPPGPEPDGSPIQFPDAPQYPYPELGAADAVDGPALDLPGPGTDADGPLDLSGGDALSPADGPTQPLTEIVLVALNQAETGNLGGLVGADVKCQAQALAAGVQGKYRAFLSSSKSDVKDLLTGAEAALPVVNSKGQQMFSSWSSVFNTTQWASGVDLYTFSGTRVDDNTGGWTDADIWHGSSPSGTAASGYTCQDWTSGSSGDRGRNGEVDARELLRQETHDCDNTFAVACVKVAP